MLFIVLISHQSPSCVATKCSHFKVGFSASSLFLTLESSSTVLLSCAYKMQRNHVNPNVTPQGVPMDHKIISSLSSGWRGLFFIWWPAHHRPPPVLPLTGASRTTRSVSRMPWASLWLAHWYPVLCIEPPSPVSSSGKLLITLQPQTCLPQPACVAVIYNGPPTVLTVTPWHLSPLVVTLVLPDTSFLTESIEWVQEVSMPQFIQE